VPSTKGIIRRSASDLSASALRLLTRSTHRQSRGGLRCRTSPFAYQNINSRKAADSEPYSSGNSTRSAARQPAAAELGCFSCRDAAASSMADRGRLFAADRPSPRRCNPDGHHLDRLRARHHHLALCYCKPAPDEPGQHAAAEAVTEHEQLKRAAALLSSSCRASSERSARQRRTSSRAGPIKNNSVMSIFAQTRGTGSRQ
jgi:hypothetical protein